MISEKQVIHQIARLKYRARTEHYSFVGRYFFAHTSKWLAIWILNVKRSLSDVRAIDSTDVTQVTDSLNRSLVLVTSHERIARAYE